MIHSAGHSFDKFKVLGNFGTKYNAAHTTKDRGSNTIHRYLFQKKQENHAIINSVVDEIRMIESRKLSAVNHEAPEFLEIITMITTCTRWKI